MVRGNSRFDEATVKSWILTRPGTKYSPKKLDGDVRRLFSTGHFTDVKVLWEQEDNSEGSTDRAIIFEVMERPLIAEINIDFSANLSKADILSRLRHSDAGIAVGEEFDPVKVRGAAKLIEQMMRSDATQQFKITAFVEDVARTSVRVIFKIE